MAISVLMRMPPDKEALLGVHRQALTAHDVETIVGHAGRDVACMRDGDYVGTGRDALRRALEAEYAGNADLLARVMTLDGESVLVEYDVPTREPRAVFHVESESDRITGLRIDHDRALFDRLVHSAQKH